MSLQVEVKFTFLEAILVLELDDHLAIVLVDELFVLLAEDTLDANRV